MFTVGRGVLELWFVSDIGKPFNKQLPRYYIHKDETLAPPPLSEQATETAIWPTIDVHAEISQPASDMSDPYAHMYVVRSTHVFHPSSTVAHELWPFSRSRDQPHPHMPISQNRKRLWFCLQKKKVMDSYIRNYLLPLIYPLFPPSRLPPIKRQSPYPCRCRPRTQQSSSPPCPLDPRSSPPRPSGPSSLTKWWFGRRSPAPTTIDRSGSFRRMRRPWLRFLGLGLRGPRRLMSLALFW